MGKENNIKQGDKVYFGKYRDKIWNVRNNPGTIPGWYNRVWLEDSDGYRFHAHVDTLTKVE
jgi:hypothetical protein